MTPRRVGFLLAGLCILVSATLGFLYASPRGDLAAQDRQPVAFSHAQHAGRLGIHCLYCHRAAEQSSTAGIPTMQLCMSCHGNMDQTSPEAKALQTYWQERTAIPWVRLQRLPDHVHFPHDRHLRSGVNCVACHGDVDTYEHTPRAPSFEMGWCLSCHRRENASVDCLTCHK